jgi:hypothetical protein
MTTVQKPCTCNILHHDHTYIWYVDRITFQKNNNLISITLTSTPCMLMWKSEITWAAGLPQTVYDTKFELTFTKYAKVTNNDVPTRIHSISRIKIFTQEFNMSNNKIIRACPCNFQTCEGSSYTWGCLTVGQAQHGSRNWFINTRQFFYKLTSKILLYYVSKDE